MTRTLLPLLLLSLPLLAAHADIYSWVDANNVKHFTQDAPPRGTPYTRIKPDVSAPNPAPAIDSLKKSQQARETALTGGAKTREAGLRLKAETLERCAKARERISFLEEKTARRLFRTGPDGQPARYTDEEFAAELNQARAQESANCV